MQRLATFDITSGFDTTNSRLMAQFAFGIACTLKMILIRIPIDALIPTEGPFALIYPTLLIATLYGHWRAGMVAWVLTFAWVWYMLLQPVGSFDIVSEFDSERLTLNAGAGLLTVYLAETFRSAVKEAVSERDAEIRRRTMLMREIDHRTKNNFSLVVSLLELQKRKETDPSVVGALEMATARIHSFARAYANLEQSQGEDDRVQMRPYIGEVVRRFSGGAFHDGIEVQVDTADCLLPREIAVAIGLFVNEALTNVAKHAFPNGQPGRVSVKLSGNAKHWGVLVADNGTSNDKMGSEGGLGTTLLNAFARQANARYELDIAQTGRRLRLISL